MGKSAHGAMGALSRVREYLTRLDEHVDDQEELRTML